MIPTIGVMIGAYVGLRSVEIAFTPGNRFKSRFGHVVVVTTGVIVAVITALGTSSILVGKNAFTAAVLR